MRNLEILGNPCLDVRSAMSAQLHYNIGSARHLKRSFTQNRMHVSSRYLKNSFGLFVASR